MTLPTSHVEESLKLTSDGLVDLFKINIKNTSTFICFTTREPIKWDGDNYESVFCRLDGDSQNSDGQEVRPTLTIQNPEGVFTPYLLNGTLDLSLVTRYRVLRTHLEANIKISQRRLWYVSAVTNIISGQSFTLNLRNMSEGPTFWLPARTFSPPDFPSVSL